MSRGRRWPGKALGLVAVSAPVLALSTAVTPTGMVEAVPKFVESHAPMESASPSHANHGHGKKSSGAVQTSLDWAGYAVTGATFSYVAGDWTQPTATCPKNQVQQAAFWVGIDGYAASDPTVQQIGTDSDCTKGKGKKGGPNYYAWYQLYPQPYVMLPTSSYPVAHGDAISASISVSGSVYTLSISDGTKWHYSTNQTPTTARPQNSSAEWITEAPCTGSHCKVLPLADFGAINFTSASANHQPISSSAVTGNQIDMTNKSGKKTKAKTSALSGGGSAFTVTWMSN